MQQHNYTPDELCSSQDKDINNLGEIQDNQEIKEQEKSNLSRDPCQNIDQFSLKEEINRLTKVEDPIPHTRIFDVMLEQIHSVDFKSIVFPGNDDERVKVLEKHYLILVTEELLRVASKNNWGLRRYNGSIYIFNGAYWLNIDKDAFQKFLGIAALKMEVPNYSAKFFLFRDKLFKQFQSEAYLPSPEPAMDKVLINLKNGTLEVSLKGHKIRPFLSSDFLTYQLPFEYDEKAQAPIFQKYLDRVIPDMEKQRVLAEYLGLLFIRHGSNTIKEEKALILLGSGANGKSVFFEIVSAVMGKDNISNYSLQALTNESGYHRAKIADKLVNYASEINGKLEASLFKQLVSGEPVEARLPYGEPFIMSQYARLIFNCNELPRDIEHTNAFFRRFLIIPFDVTIPEQEQDKMLHKKIIDNELSGILNWILEGLKRLIDQQHFSECKSAEMANEQYRTDSDSVRFFLEESNLKPCTIHYKLIGDLYTDYRVFCLEDGFKPVQKVNFRKRLEGLGITVERKSEGNVVYLSRGAF
jgi:putative DNA primase/helicase